VWGTAPQIEREPTVERCGDAPDANHYEQKKGAVLIDRPEQETAKEERQQAKAENAARRPIPPPNIPPSRQPVTAPRPERYLRIGLWRAASFRRSTGPPTMAAIEPDPQVPMSAIEANEMASSVLLSRPALKISFTAPGGPLPGRFLPSFRLGHKQLNEKVNNAGSGARQHHPAPGGLRDFEINAHHRNQYKADVRRRADHAREQGSFLSRPRFPSPEPRRATFATHPESRDKSQQTKVPWFLAK